MIKLKSKASIRSEATNKKEQPDFFKDLEENFIQRMQDMGYDFMDVKDLIEEAGVPVLSEQLVVDALSKKDQYRNPLLMPRDGEVGF